MTSRPAAPEAPESGADQALIASAQAGNFSAFEALVRKYHGRLYRLVLSMLRDEASAYEVLQEAFLSAFRGLPQFRRDSRPSTWLYRIAVNATLMHLRHESRRPELSFASEPLEFQEAGTAWLSPPSDWSLQPEERLLSQETRETIQEAIAALPEKYRLVLLLRDVEGLSSEEVSNTLGLTVASVKSRLHRARLFVRRHLEDYFQRTSSSER